MLGNRGGFERQMSARIQNNVEQPQEDGEIGQGESGEVKSVSNLSQNPVVYGVTRGAWVLVKRVSAFPAVGFALPFTGLNALCRVTSADFSALEMFTVHLCRTLKNQA